MRNLRSVLTLKRLLTAAAFLSLVFVAGCDEYVQVTRDHDAHIVKGATWAWRPVVVLLAARENRSGDNRPVTSRDDLTRTPRNQPAPRVPDANDEVVRQRVRDAIAQTLTSKGLKQVSDPAAADFLIDYKFAVNRHNATVPVGYPGAYPGLVCGPYRCWDSWGLWPCVRRLRKHSLPRRDDRLRLCAASEQAPGLPRCWPKTGEARCFLTYPGRYQQPCSSFAWRFEAKQEVESFGTRFQSQRGTGIPARLCPVLHLAETKAAARRPRRYSGCRRIPCRWPPSA